MALFSAIVDVFTAKIRKQIQGEVDTFITSLCQKISADADGSGDAFVAKIAKQIAHDYNLDYTEIKARYCGKGSFQVQVQSSKCEALVPDSSKKKVADEEEEEIPEVFLAHNWDKVPSAKHLSPTPSAKHLSPTPSAKHLSPTPSAKSPTPPPVPAKTSVSPDTPAPPPLMAFSKMKKPDLVAECEMRGLDSDGTVVQLKERVKDARASDEPTKKVRKPRAPKEPKKVKEPKEPKKKVKESPPPPPPPKVVVPLEEEGDSEDEEFEEEEEEEGDTCRERLRKMLASECKLPLCENKGCEKDDDMCKPIEDELRAPSGGSMDERLRKILAEAAADGGFEDEDEDAGEDEEEDEEEEFSEYEY
jgi:hypothetical protein